MWGVDLAKGDSIYQPLANFLEQVPTGSKLQWTLDKCHKTVVISSWLSEQAPCKTNTWFKSKIFFFFKWGSLTAKAFYLEMWNFTLWRVLANSTNKLSLQTSYLNYTGFHNQGCQITLKCFHTLKWTPCSIIKKCLLILPFRGILDNH